MILALLLTACTGPPPTAEGYAIASASPPAHWLATRIAGEATRLDGPPSPEALAGVDLLVANGAGYEAWLDEVPARLVVDTSDGLDVIPGDPRTWTDPETYLLQGRALYDRLARENGRQRPVYDEGLAALERDLQAVDAALAESLAPARGAPVAATAPAWGYLARRYGLELTVVDLSDGDASPLEVWAERTGGSVVLWPAPPPDGMAVPELRHTVIDPLDGPGDYLPAARRNAATLAEAFTATP